MNTDRNELFASANLELLAFLSQADGLVQGTSDLGAEDLRAIGRLLETMAPEMAKSPRNGCDDAGAREQVQRYISNLRSLQVSLEQVRCVMLARRAKLEAARQHVEGVRGWADAYRQTS
jgi:hypothetical protein